MASNFLSFDPESVASTSDAASSAYDLAATASDTASSAYDKAAAASAAVAGKADVAYETAPAASSIAGFRGSFQASEALAFPQLCYMNTNGFMGLANANSAATATAFLTMAPGSVANAASFAAIMPGTMVGHTAWNWTIGAPIYMKSSAGGMTQTRPSAASAIVRIVGYGGRNSNVMFFNPDGTWVEVT